MSESLVPVQNKGILEINLWCKISCPHLATGVWSAASDVWQELNSKLGNHVTDHLPSKKFRWSSSPPQHTMQTDRQKEYITTLLFLLWAGTDCSWKASLCLHRVWRLVWARCWAITLGLGERHWNHLNSYVYLGLLSIGAFISRISWCCQFQGIPRTDSGVSSDLMSLLLSACFCFQEVTSLQPWTWL